MKVAYTRDAQSDLLEIHRWIFEDNPKRANSFIDELEAVCEALGLTPEAYPIVFEQTHNVVRRRVYKSFLIFYRVKLTHLVILRIGHSAQNWSQELFD